MNVSIDYTFFHVLNLHWELFQLYQNIKPVITQVLAAAEVVQKQAIRIHVIPYPTYPIPKRINTKVQAQDTHVTIRLHIQHPSPAPQIQLTGRRHIHRHRIHQIAASHRHHHLHHRPKQTTFIIKIVIQTITVSMYRLVRLHLHPCKIILT